MTYTSRSKIVNGHKHTQTRLRKQAITQHTARWRVEWWNAMRSTCTVQWTRRLRMSRTCSVAEVGTSRRQMHHWY